MTNQPPDEQQIREMLTQLHDELEHTQTLDDDERAMMRHLMSDIQQMLNRQDAGQGMQYKPDRSFVNRLRKALDMMEVSHPTLTLMMEKALDTLNIAGI